MNQKFFLQSTTVRGLLIACVGFILHLLLMFGQINNESYMLLSRYVALIADFLGVSTAFYGRYVSTGAKLTLTPNSEK